MRPQNGPDAAPPPAARISRAEWRWAAVFALLVIAATTVPYLAALGTERDGWRFGGFLIGVEDGNTYLAKMRQGADGQLLNVLNHTTEPQSPAFLYPLLHVAGWLAGPEPARLIAAYHGLRIGAGMLLLLVSYAFVAQFVSGLRARRLALALVAAGGGLGWLVTLLWPDRLLESLPLDFIVPEAFSFLMLFGLGHLALGRTLLLAALLAYLAGRGGWAGAALLGAGLAQPLYVPVGWAVMGAHAGVGWVLDRATPGKRREPAESLARAAAVADLRSALIAVGVSTPLVIYTAAILWADPVLRQWMAQNRLPSPHPIHFVLAYGVWLIPAAAGLRRLWARSPRLALFAGAWLALAPLLAYAPISTQRRLVEGVQLPLVALAVIGLQGLGARWRRGAVAGLLVLTLPTTLLLWLGALAAARDVREPQFRPPDELRVFGWLRQAAEPGQAVLAAYPTGNALPAYAPVHSYVGHGPETIHLEVKLPRVAAFYQAETPDSERLRLLDEAGIDYVFFGPHEAALGGFDLDEATYLSLLFASGEYAVYGVRR